MSPAGRMIFASIQGSKVLLFQMPSRRSRIQSCFGSGLRANKIFLLRCWDKSVDT